MKQYILLYWKLWDLDSVPTGPRQRKKLLICFIWGTWNAPILVHFSTRWAALLTLLCLQACVTHVPACARLGKEGGVEHIPNPVGYYCPNIIKAVSGLQLAELSELCFVSGLFFFVGVQGSKCSCWRTVWKMVLHSAACSICLSCYSDHIPLCPGSWCLPILGTRLSLSAGMVLTPSLSSC